MPQGSAPARHNTLSEGSVPFRFLDLRERTPGLTGRERKEVCAALPEVMQREAWTDLAEWANRRSDRDFEIWCRDEL